MIVYLPTSKYVNQRPFSLVPVWRGWLRFWYPIPIGHNSRQKLVRLLPDSRPWKLYTGIATSYCCLLQWVGVCCWWLAPSFSQRVSKMIVSRCHPNLRVVGADPATNSPQFCRRYWRYYAFVELNNYSSTAIFVVSRLSQEPRIGHLRQFSKHFYNHPVGSTTRIYIDITAQLVFNSCFFPFEWLPLKGHAHCYCVFFESFGKTSLYGNMWLAWVVYLGVVISITLAPPIGWLRGFWRRGERVPLKRISDYLLRW